MFVLFHPPQSALLIEQTPVGCFLEVSYASVVRNKIVMRQESEKDREVQAWGILESI